MPDSLIFDVDGTLWDSRPQVRCAWSSLVEELTGKPWNISDADFSGLFGCPMDVIAAALFPDENNPEERMRKGQICFDAENRWLADHPGTLFKGIRQSLRMLADRYPLYIVSNCNVGYIETMLRSTGLESLFRGHLCFGETGTPKGRTIRILMSRYQLESPIYIGDTQGDADACRSAGIPFIYAEYGFGTVPDAAWRISAPEELPILCERLSKLPEGK